MFGREAERWARAKADKLRGEMTTTTAILHPRRTSGAERYDVTLDGEEIVTATSNPEVDAARACQRRGIGGRLQLIDGHRPAPVNLRH
jgi:hypothetical protein